MRRRRRETRSQKQSVRRGSGGHLFYSESIRELFLSETFFVKPKKILHSLVICPIHTSVVFVTKVVKTI